MSKRILSILGAFGLLAGCSCNQSNQRLAQAFEVAGAIGTARHLAHCIDVDLNAANDVPDAEKKDLLARARILDAHADQIDTSLDRYDASGAQGNGVSMANLQARREALDEEYRTTFREWCIWQVRNGRKKPEEVFQVFDYAADLR